MRRSGPALAAFLACALAGLFLAFVVASGVGAQGLVTTGSTTEPEPGLIPPGVTIGGIAVGGLSPESATFMVQERFEQGLPLIFRGRPRLAPSPHVLGATARIDQAVERALERSARGRGRADRPHQRRHDTRLRPVGGAPLQPRAGRRRARAPQAPPEDRARADGRRPSSAPSSPPTSTVASPR